MTLLRRAFVRLRVASGSIASISMPLAAAEDLDTTVRSIAGFDSSTRKTTLAKAWACTLATGASIPLRKVSEALRCKRP